MNLAKTITELFNLRYSQNVQFFKDLNDNAAFNELFIAEINSCGNLHQFIQNHSNLFYSEYSSSIPDVKSENLMNLSYDDNFFDIVLLSDVLEHVPDYERALFEVKRVLKQNAIFIFTVPYLLDRKTIIRSEIIGNGMIHNIYTEMFIVLTQI